MHVSYNNTYHTHHACVVANMLPRHAGPQDELFVGPQEVSDLSSSVISTHNCKPSSADLQLSGDQYEQKEN